MTSCCAFKDFYCDVISLFCHGASLYEFCSVMFIIVSLLITSYDSRLYVDHLFILLWINIFNNLIRCEFGYVDWCTGGMWICLVKLLMFGGRKQRLVILPFFYFYLFIWVSLKVLLSFLTTQHKWQDKQPELSTTWVRSSDWGSGQTLAVCHVNLHLYPYRGK